MCEVLLEPCVSQLVFTPSNGQQDFIGVSQALAFSAGREDARRDVIFTVRDDDLPEQDERFRVRLFVTNGDGDAGDPDSTMVTIRANDDAYGIFSLATVRALFCDRMPSDSIFLYDVKLSKDK